MVVNFISPSDFVLKINRSNPTQKILYNKIPNFSIVLFYSDECKPSLDFLPIYNNLDKKINHVVICKINIGKMDNRYIIEMSKKTMDEIDYTPTIIFYNNGRPISKIEGSVSDKDITQLVKEITETTNNSMKKRFKNNLSEGGNIYFISSPNITPGCKTKIAHK